MVRKENEPGVSNLLTRGIAAVKAGKHEEARSLLIDALRQDANNEQAWLWLGAVIGSPRETLVCLRRVLALDPHNRQAQEGIKWAKARLAQSRGSSPSPSMAPSRGGSEGPTSSPVTSGSHLAAGFSAIREGSLVQRASETTVLPPSSASAPSANPMVGVVSPPSVKHTVKSLAQEQENEGAALGPSRARLIPLLIVLLLSLTFVIGLALLQWLLSP